MHRFSRPAPISLRQRERHERSCHQSSVRLRHSATRTLKPAWDAAFPSRSSKQTKGRRRGLSRHHTRAAPSCNASAPRTPYSSGSASANDRTFSDGCTSSQEARSCPSSLIAVVRSASVSCPSRSRRANALRASTGVPHHTTMRRSSRSSFRPRLVAVCEQHSGTIALASQNATFQRSSRSSRTAAAAASGRTAGRRVFQNEAGSGRAALRISPAATKGPSSASSSSMDSGTIFAIGRSRSRTMISSPARTSLRYCVNRFRRSAMFVLRTEPPTWPS